MDKSRLNRMNKELQEFKLSVEQATPTEKNAELLERLKTQIDNMESTFMELRGSDNPANKIYQWFKNHFATKPEYSCFDIKATDSAFILFICGEKAFNFNLKNEPNTWRVQNENDWRVFRTIGTPGAIHNEHSGWFQKEAFAPFIFPQNNVGLYYKKITIEFKFSRRVFKDPQEMDTFLSAFVAHTYNCCLRHRKQEQAS